MSDNLTPPEQPENNCLYCDEPCINNFCDDYCKDGYKSEA